ncbi:MULTISPECIES: TVP38/TMEM64 family protein [Halomonadaceae]|jgi:uncharacterized membrane protein YdjX (TVP38/TMEM64 family)|uniref:TVP38/TMEM64 family protein n=1 Tax=Halomonadaceae TaxID=28256 RepID=UPI0013D369D7|nr:MULTISPECIES: TVP38/TMEM64 family protein [Halomonadaceae]MDV6317671.1 TVP38/TMEM64 family protein [Chromohalobacter sp. HP20-39]
MASKPDMTFRLIRGIAILSGLIVIYLLLMEFGILSIITNKQALREWVVQLGHWGPIIIIGLMMVAIVMSPIPSGPIAMVAGATYGSIWGTIYIVIGAELGALIAFCVARQLGYEVLQGWPRIRPLMSWLGKERSQAGLMFIVFASRLIPFLSFDAISYAAGLTPLAFWRFLLATLAGVVPTAYLITMFGEVLITTGSRGGMVAIALISSITLLPILLRLLWIWLRKRWNEKF